MVGRAGLVWLLVGGFVGGLACWGVLVTPHGYRQHGAWFEFCCVYSPPESASWYSLLRRSSQLASHARARDRAGGEPARGYAKRGVGGWARARGKRAGPVGAVSAVRDQFRPGFWGRLMVEHPLVSVWLPGKRAVWGRRGHRPGAAGGPGLKCQTVRRGSGPSPQPLTGTVSVHGCTQFVPAPCRPRAVPGSKFWAVPGRLLDMSPGALSRLFWRC